VSALAPCVERALYLLTMTRSGRLPRTASACDGADRVNARLKATIQRDGESCPIAPATLNRELAALRCLLREAQGRLRYLTEEERVRLLAACEKSRNKDLFGVVTVALETGMRRGEILGLTWDRVDLSRGVLRLEITKSGRRREVPMRQAVYNVLAARPEHRVGRVWPDRQIRKAFETAVAAARLDDFRFHDLRHTFASNFVMRGGSLQSLKEILGHGSMAMTLRYAHLAPEHVRGEMERTARALDAALPGTSSGHNARARLSIAPV
jgi:integrase